MAKTCPIANRIRDFRESRGQMSQQDLADAIGVTRQTIHAIETRKYSPSLESAFRIALTFGVKLEDVFNWDGNAVDG